MAGLRLNLDPTGMVTGAKQAENALERVATASVRTQSAVSRIDTAMTGVGRGMAGARGQIQNVAFQLGDFATQVGAGTAASVALGQQLPQLLGGFGALGAVLGAVVAIGVPLGAAFLSAGRDAKEAGEAIDDLAESVDDFRAAVEFANLSADELTIKVGAATPAIRQLALEMAAIEKIKAYESLDALAESAAALFDPSWWDDRSIQSVAQDFLELSSFLQSSRDVAAGFVRDLQTLGDASDEVERLKAALSLKETLLANVGPFEEMNETQRKFLVMLNEIIMKEEILGVTSQELAATFFDISDAAYNVAAGADAAASAVAGIGSAAEGAFGAVSRLASEIWSAAMGRAQATAYVENATLIGQYQLYADSRSAAPKTPVVHPVKRGGSAGSGGGVSDAEREAARWFEETRTEAEQYAEAIAELDSLLGQGLITQDTYNRGLEQTAAKYLEVGDAVEFLKGINTDLKEATLDALLDMENGFDDVAKAIKRAALESALFGSGPLAGLFGGGKGLLGGLLGNTFAGLFDAGGTIKSGQTGIVGEYGPELVTAGSNGAVVTSRTATAGMMQPAQVQVTGGELVLTDSGQIAARISVTAQQAGEQAVATSRRSLPGWQSELQRTGALV